MVATKTNYDQKSEVKAFDETKEGVKGLVDEGITEVPRIFHQPPESDIGDQGRWGLAQTSSDPQHQLISNDGFKSIQHKVLAKYVGPGYLLRTSSVQGCYR
ncbi:hypothetical protein ACFX2I_022231 [Malus domestica]